MGASARMQPPVYIRQPHVYGRVFTLERKSANQMSVSRITFHNIMTSLSSCALQNVLSCRKWETRFGCNVMGTCMGAWA
jgi:hypothetical protein